MQDKKTESFLFGFAVGAIIFCFSFSYILSRFVESVKKDSTQIVDSSFIGTTNYKKPTPKLDSVKYSKILNKYGLK